MATPSQDLIVCKGCNQSKPHHPKRKLYCVECINKKQVDYQRAFRNRQKELAKTVICKGCGKEFTTERNGRSWRCHDCIIKYQQEYAAKDKQRHAQYSRNYRARLGDTYRERLVKRRAELISKMSESELAEFRKKESEKSARLFAILKEQVFSAYGGYKCSCCGETEPLFLSIDHVDNNGAEMRNNGTHGRSGTAFYQWLRKNKFPDGFQVLCMNCNVGKHRNGGICPHQLSKV